MSNSRGRRYQGSEPKLNIKKVIAVIIVFIVIIMAISSIKKMFSGNKTNEKPVANAYYSVYTNGKWGVINSKGEIIINPEYDEAIIIPDNKKDVFLCTYDVDYSKNTYKTKVLNSKNEEIITDYDEVTALENYDSSNNLSYETDVLLVKKDNKYGLADYKGKELLKCEYESIEALKGVGKSFLTKKDGKLGLVDNIGSIIIENTYKAITPISEKFENGYIVTNDSNKKGVIGRDKSEVLEVKYDDIKQIYGSDLYVVKEGKSWELVNNEGTTYLKDKFSDVISINGENVLVKQNGKYGVLTTSGEQKIAIKYDDMKYAFENNYIYKENGNYGVININAETVLKPEYETLIYREDAGFFEGSKKNQAESDFIGTDFEVKLTGILSELNITNGYMQIRIGSEYKYYNFKFEEKTNIELLTTNTIFLSKKDGKYGYVNKNGVVVVDYIYDDAKEQNEFGYASVKKNGMWGCINSKGEEVIAPAYKLENSYVIEFINKWHRGEDLNLNYYTD